MERMRCPDLEGFVMDPLDAVEKLVPRRGVIATGGMSGSAVPKEFPRALANYARDKDLSLILLTGGATTQVYEDYLGSIARVFTRRYPYLSGGEFRRLVNDGFISFFDYGLNKFNKLVRRGFLSIDVAVFEATEIGDDCGIVPSTSLDATLSFIRSARKVIIEVNTSKPTLYGLHDAFVPSDWDVVPIRDVKDRVGEAKIRVPREKLGAVILTNIPDSAPSSYKAPSSVEARISENIINFLTSEARRGYMKYLVDNDRLVIQPGGGSLSSALADRIREAGFRFSVWAETIPVKWTTLIGDSVGGISTSALYILPGEDNYLGRFYSELDEIIGRVLVRGQEVSNNPEVIQRLNVISIQQAIEVDIYGNVNVSHIGGAIYNGVGGSVDFAPNAHILIVALPSVTNDGKVSRIVPMTTHVDIPEHYVDVVITEQGIADLRGLSPLERARAIIENCANPKFRDVLLRYYEAMRNRGHEPHDLELVRKFHMEWSL